MFLLFFTKKGELVGLSDDKDHEKWFDRKLIEDKPFWEVYRQVLVEEGKMLIFFSLLCLTMLSLYVIDL